MAIIMKYETIVKQEIHNDQSVSVHYIKDIKALGPVYYPGENTPSEFYDYVPRQVWRVEGNNGCVKRVVDIYIIPRFRSTKGDHVFRVLPEGVVTFKRYSADDIQEHIEYWLDCLDEKDPEEVMQKKLATFDSPCYETTLVWLIWFLQNYENMQGILFNILVTLDAHKYCASSVVNIMIELMHAEHWLTIAVKDISVKGEKLKPYYDTMNRNVKHAQKLKTAAEL